MENGTAIVENRFLEKLNIELSYDPAVELRHLLTTAHCSIIHSGQKMETTQC